MTQIADNIARVRERMNAAALRAGRKPEEIRLVAVSKTVEPERILQALEAGVDILGENYVQEAQKKIEALGGRASWHFIGHLQSNKAKLAVRLFDFFHAVDNLKLAQELSRSTPDGKPVPILIQVNLAGEESKFGAAEGEVSRLVEAISGLPGVAVKGLMTLPPFFEDPQESRPYFASLRKLAESIREQKIPRISLEELSMGMSHDFEVAIEEGATLIRVGTAIFGLRPPKE